MIRYDSWAEGVVRRAGRYLSLVQSRTHARRARVAMFWSAASLFFVLGNLQAQTVLHVPLVGGFSNIKPEFFLSFLLIMTAYYFARFLFSVLKINAKVNLRSLQKSVRAYYTHFKIMCIPIVTDSVWKNLRAQWYMQRVNREDTGDRDAFFVLFNWVHHPNSGGKSPASDLHQIENAAKVRDMLEYPVFSALENGFARIFLPALLSIMALLAIVWKLFPEIGQPLAAFVSIFLTVFLTHTIDELIF